MVISLSEQNLYNTGSHFDKVPNELIVKIASSLSEEECSVVELVCKRFYQVVNDDSFWAKFLQESGQKIMPGKAKLQAVAYLREYCLLFL